MATPSGSTSGWKWPASRIAVGQSLAAAKPLPIPRVAIDRIAVLADGRMLAYCEWGDPTVTPGSYGFQTGSEVGQGPSGSGAAWRQRAMVVVTMAKPKPRSSMGAQAMRGPRIAAGL